MLVEFFRSLHLRGKSFDVLSLHLLDHLEEISCVPFQNWEDGAVTRWPVWADEHYHDISAIGIGILSRAIKRTKKVWKVWSGDA
jgi:hypothetical protein